MAKRPVLSTISNILTSLPFINSNYDAVDVAFDNTLSRDGSTPNNMLADLDMDGNSINNANVVRADSVVLNGTVLSTSSTVAAADAVDVGIADAGGFYTGVTAEAALQEVGADIVALEAVDATLGTVVTLDASNAADFASVDTTDVPNRAAIATEIDTKIAAEITEGTWTPVLGAVSGGTLTAYTSATEQVGWYQKRGNLVTVWFTVTYSSVGLNGTSGLLQVTLSGLPLTFGNTNVSQSSVLIPVNVYTTASGLGTDFNIVYGISGTDRVGLNLTEDALDGNDVESELIRVRGSFSYITDE